jgi:hypothetical protein
MEHKTVKTPIINEIDKMKNTFRMNPIRMYNSENPNLLILFSIFVF